MDEFPAYDPPTVCGYRHLWMGHENRFSRGKFYINAHEGFWSYAKERIINFQGVSKERVPFGEMEV